MVGVSEKQFETEIETALAAQGYEKGRPEDYHQALVLLPKTVLRFAQATQPKEWAKLKEQYKGEAEERFLARLSAEIERRGTLDVLRNGVRDVGARVSLAFFRPPTMLNPETQKLYQANVFTVVRQLEYVEQGGRPRYPNVTIFLNGLPVFTAELKNPLTGQSVLNAIEQYKKDRDPREPLLSFRRCLAHFAVDPDSMYMTTHLRKDQTEFLPFNRGRNGGAGNEPSAFDFASAYLWKEVWAPDSILNLVQHFISDVDELDDDGNPTGRRLLLFPRYHQLTAVRRLVADARENGVGRQYLVQHSAGSGKSNSIAWLAHQLTTLHDNDDRRIFDSVIVITDRRVLDRQLQTTVRQFEQQRGLVENVDTTSRQLKRALEDGKQIIVSTLQKFPVIASQVAAMPGTRFAVIIDEAHSSQSGESRQYLNEVLATGDLAEAEARDEAAEGGDLEDLIVAEMRKRGRLPNVSSFAFTATPKEETLVLFGTRGPRGYEPFSLYSMRQAIEEGFILDVLQNYVTYEEEWKLLKTIQDDPRYDSAKAKALLRHFVDVHEHTISKKTAIIVEHFHHYTAHRIAGRAKAMVVTRSRLHAVRYRLAIERYLKEHGYPYRALVAFSGKVEDGAKEYTEAGMNGFPEKQTADTFSGPEYRIIVVASKFQTGFDEPLLHTMYVDKRLGGVNAVQTLSRANRIHPPHKEDTAVLDFANSTDDIRKAFEPYYDRTWLKGATDPNLLYDLQHRIQSQHFFTTEEVQRFAQAFYDTKDSQYKLHMHLQPALDRYEEARDEDREHFRGQVKQFVELYGFLSQILTFTDAELHKLFLFLRFLLRKLTVKKGELPLEVLNQVDMDSLAIHKRTEATIKLTAGEGSLAPAKLGDATPRQPEAIEPLSQIIRDLNERFGANLTEDDKVFIQRLEDALAADPTIADSIRVNTEENARLTFDRVVNDRIQDMIDTNFKFYKLVTDNKAFSESFMGWLFERYKNTNAETSQRR